MPANFDLGDNYQIDEDSNGDLVITDGSGNTVIKHDNSASEWTFEQTVKATPSPTESNDVAIKDYVDSVAQGLDWQDSVIDEQNTPPSSPSTGDRYLVDDSPTRDWSGHPNEIAEWDGSQWAFSAPNEAWSVFLEDVDLLKVYDNTNWVAFGSAIDHGALAGLADDDHTQYLLVDGTRAMSGGLDMGNNAISNASSVSTTELFTEPAGARLTKTSNQTIPSGSPQTVTWESATERNSDADTFADLTNNAITIPNDEYSVARVGFGLRTDTHEWDFARPKLNGNRFDGTSDIDISSNVTICGGLWSDWVSVSQGDSFTLDFRQSTGNDQSVQSDEPTWLAVEAY